MKKYGIEPFLTILLSIISLLNFASFAQAACGGANCNLVTGTQNGLMGKNRIVMDISFRYIVSESPHFGSNSENEALIPKIDFANREIELEHHREFKTENKLAQFDVSYGVTDKFTISINMPFLNDRFHEHDDGVTPSTPGGVFSDLDGASGFGDLTIMGKYSLWQTTKHQFIGGFGVKFPTGVYRAKDSSGQINEPTIMPGTGSFDVILSGLYNYSVIPQKLALFTSVSHRFTTRNPLEYIFGDTTLVNVGANYAVTKKINLSAQINTRIKQRDEYIHFSVPSTGGEFIFITPGARLVVTDALSVYSHVQVPIHQRVNEGNLVPDYGLMVGASYGF